MAFKMRCPKCYGLDYSIERDNRTFGAVAQAFELVFHCRCGKQLFGELLLKEYDAQKKAYDTNGEQGLPRPQGFPSRYPDSDRDELAALRARVTPDEIGRRDDSEDSEEEDRSEDDDRSPPDRRWQLRMAAITADDGDDLDDSEEDETPIPASRRGKSTPPPPATAGPGRRNRSAVPEATPAGVASAPEPGDTARETQEPAAQVARPARAKSAPPAPRPAAGRKSKPPSKPPSSVAPSSLAPSSLAPSSVAPAAEAAPANPPTSAASTAADAGSDEDLEEEDDDADDGGTICAWTGCGNERRPNSKYCSRACSNKNARLRHKTRGKKPRGRKSSHAA